ncbi:hypothetical protein DFJ74DRAFT_317841 [Hyaloraphidium curvatum]|nr:hypothetical protein DFJ74DRAFT_317841 [Hyaloraphidium curvatum]
MGDGMRVFGSSFQVRAMASMTARTRGASLPAAARCAATVTSASEPTKFWKTPPPPSTLGCQILRGGLLGGGGSAGRGGSGERGSGAVHGGARHRGGGRGEDGENAMQRAPATAPAGTQGAGDSKARRGRVQQDNTPVASESIPGLLRDGALDRPCRGGQMELDAAMPRSHVRAHRLQRPRKRTTPRRAKGGPDIAFGRDSGLGVVPRDGPCGAVFGRAAYRRWWTGDADFGRHSGARARAARKLRLAVL